MGRASRDKKTRQELKEATRMREGLIRVSFVLGDKEYARTHQLTAHEIRTLKNNIVEFGDNAAGSILWRACVYGAGRLGEAILAEAARGYMKQNRVPEQGTRGNQQAAKENSDETVSSE